MLKSKNFAWYAKNIHQSDFISLYVRIFARGNCSTVGMNTIVRFTVRGLRKTRPECWKQAVQTTPI